MNLAIRGIFGDIRWNSEGTLVKDAFAEFGATVVSVEAAHGRGGWTRRRVAELIRDALPERVAQEVKSLVSLSQEFAKAVKVDGAAEDITVSATHITLTDDDGDEVSTNNAGLWAF